MVVKGTVVETFPILMLLPLFYHILSLVMLYESGGKMTSIVGFTAWIPSGK